MIAEKASDLIRAGYDREGAEWPVTETDGGLLGDEQRWTGRIYGEGWSDAPAQIEVLQPATGEVIAHAGVADAEAVAARRRVGRGRAARRGRRRRSPSARAILRRAADLLEAPRRRDHALDGARDRLDPAEDRRRDHQLRQPDPPGHGPRDGAAGATCCPPRSPTAPGSPTASRSASSASSRHGTSRSCSRCARSRRRSRSATRSILKSDPNTPVTGRRADRARLRGGGPAAQGCCTSSRGGAEVGRR